MRNNYDKKEPKIYRTLNGKWKVRHFVDELHAYRDKIVETKTAAENLKRAILQGEKLLSEEFPNRALTFSDLAEKWIDHARNIRRISESCIMNYRAHLKHHILPVFGSVFIQKLKIEDLENLAREINLKVPMTKSYRAVRKSRWDEELYLGDHKLSLSYQREILTVACMITKWASARRPSLLLQNPFETFKLPETPEHLYDYWRIEDEDKFFDWLDKGAYFDPYKEGAKYRTVRKLEKADEVRDVVLIALRTGMRLGEIGALRNMDVDLDAGFIIVRGSYSSKEKCLKNTTKSKKARRIEINGDVREILERRKHIPENEAIFNIHMNPIKFFSRTCLWAGVKEIHFHSLRHTCLTNLANGYGMDKPLPLPKVQQIAGHNDIMTTMRYVHADIINETASLQWSRSERKAKSITESKQKEGLRSR